MADSTIKQGSTPTITIHVTRDLSELVADDLGADIKIMTKEEGE